MNDILTLTIDDAFEGLVQADEELGAEDNRSKKTGKMSFGRDTLSRSRDRMSMESRLSENKFIKDPNLDQEIAQVKVTGNRPSSARNSNQHASQQFEQKNARDSQRARSHDSRQPKLLQNCTVKEWLKHNAIILLDDSLKKLNLNKAMIETRNLDNFSLDDLADEKRRVKNELKRYDTEFKKAYNKVPGREEKEPMRPLYIYYKNLKVAISKLEKNLKVTQQNKDPEAQDNQNSTLNDYKKRLERLKTKRMQLRQRLEDYQAEFVKNNNRKIKYRQDIQEVAEDYDIYKNLKKEISDLEQKIRRGG